MNLEDARAIARVIPDALFEVGVSRDGNGMSTVGNIDLVENLAKDLPVVDRPVRGQNYLYIHCAIVKRRPLGT